MCVCVCVCDVKGYIRTTNRFLRMQQIFILLNLSTIVIEGGIVSTLKLNSCYRTNSRTNVNDNLVVMVDNQSILREISRWVDEGGRTFLALSANLDILRMIIGPL